MKLTFYERLLIKNKVNHSYTMVGPGAIWLKPWEQALLKFTIGPQGQSLPVTDIRTATDIPVDITTQVVYQVEPTLLTDKLLPNLPGLYEKGWQEALKFRVEYYLRQLVATCPWKMLSQEQVQAKLERRLTQSLDDDLKKMGLQVIKVYLLKVALPDNLQHAIVQAEKDTFEPRSRALILKEYATIFGNDLAKAMPYIIQWEMVNLLRKHSNPNVLLTHSGLNLGGQPSSVEPPSILQLPLFRDQQ